MNGLCGFVALDEVELAEGSALLSRMLDALAESGPAGRGTAVGAAFGIGVRSPVAPSERSRAPFRSPRGDFVLGIDGAPQLTPDGRSADEVDPEAELGAGVRAVYEHEEEGVFRRLEGEFAVALWDGRTRRMLLARDRFGSKPLFVAWGRGGRILLFASEAKAILRSGRVEGRLDGRGVLDVLSAGQLGPGRTLFSGIEQLLPGTWLSLDLRGREQRARWYEAPYPRRGGGAVARPAGAELGARLRDSLRSIPVGSAGCYLSGGIEDVLLAALLSERGPVSTFATCFDDPGFWDDRPSVAEAAAERLGADHAAVALRALDADDVVRVLRALEMPPLDPATYFEGQLYAAIAASDRRIVVAADGASALFAGAGLRSGDTPWPARVTRALLGRWRLRSWPGLARAQRSSWRTERTLRRRLGSVPLGLERWVMRAHLADRLLGRRYAPPRGLERFPLRAAESARLIASPLHRRLRGHQRQVLDGEQLWRGDRLARAVGLERRLPFLDPAVVECSSAFGHDGGGLDLGPLRALLPSRLGRRVRRRLGRRLRTPNPIWPFGPGTPGWVTEALSGRALDEPGLFDPAEVEVSLRRLSVPRSREVARIEAEVLLAVLGIQLISRSFGLGQLDWPSRPAG